MTTAAGLLSAEDFAALPTNGIRLELVRGEIRAAPPAFVDHGSAAMTLSGYVSYFVKTKKLGNVYAAETGFLLARNPDTVRAPDFAFIQASRVTSAATASSWGTIIPDLVIEAVSSGDRPKEITEKVSMWLDAGVRLVWVVYPAQREVATYCPGQPEQRLSESDMLDGLDILPGFTLAVADIFA